MRVARFGLLHSPLEASLSLLVLNRWKNPLQVQSCVPDLQSAHLGEFGHPFPVASNAPERCFASVAFAEAVAATGDEKARRQPLDIPFPRRRKRFVEIVNVEDLQAA